MKNVWLVSYIDSSKVESVVKDLRKKSIYQDVVAYIPTVKILQKNLKQKEIFEYIPMLFNYGFFKMPLPLACDEQFLSRLKSDVQCIFGWVKDPAKVIRTKPRIRPDNKSIFDLSNIPFAVATEREVANIIISEECNSVYSAKDLESLSIGQLITLKGYPFDNVQAEILHINYSKKEVKVKLLLETLLKQVTVSFDNIFYTVYRAHNPEVSSKEQSTEELKNKTSGDNKLFMEFLIQTGNE